MSTSVKLLWMKYLSNHKQNKGKKSKMLNVIGKMNMTKILFTLGVTCIMHMRSFYPYMCTSLVKQTASFASAYK